MYESSSSLMCTHSFGIFLCLSLILYIMFKDLYWFSFVPNVHSVNSACLNVYIRNMGCMCVVLYIQCIVLHIVQVHNMVYGDSFNSFFLL